MQLVNKKFIFFMYITFFGCSSVISKEMNLSITNHLVQCEMHFSKVSPDVDIFIDEKLYTVTSKNGEAKIFGCALDLGPHTIFLRKKDKIIGKFGFKIEDESKPVVIKCSGIKKMECTVFINHD